MLILIGVLGLSACAATTGCEEQTPWPEGKALVELGGRTFELEIAADDAVRTKGLAGRESIDADGGMIFVFPDSRIRKFVMRDCLTDIDIIFLDAAGNITDTHHMPAEAPRGEDEGVVGDYLNRKYHARLPQYSSRFNSKYAIELAGGTLEGLGLERGAHVDVDTDRLKSFLR
ncbi:MAG: hypothetical protein DHS20C14_16540 [Phycisphaeraceae bacterium]|nr:MAG: hypothetical protein DHS20C14_16540 [Phycisphaeraceae bacterium]